MGAYRITRNLEASLIDFISAQLTADGWVNIRTVKSFTEVYEGTLPCICIMSSNRPIERIEIGTDENTKEFIVEIRIFATNDGQRLDLSDWLIDKIMKTLIGYYNYTVVNGAVSLKTLAGRVSINTILENRKELTNTENLEQEDRYRHIIGVNCRVALT